MPDKKIPIVRFSNSGVFNVEDHVAIEEPLEIQLEYVSDEKLVRKNISVTMRTPGNDKELAAGFLFTEGIIKDHNSIEHVSSAANNSISVKLRDNCVPLMQSADRNFYTTSSCGVCGKSSIDAIKAVSPFTIIDDNIKLAPALITSLPELIKNQQQSFEKTGGLHAAALFDLNGNLILLHEDVGRHNAVDKVIGEAGFKSLLPLSENILLLSGRAGFELIQKANMAGIKIVVAIGAPSSLAVELATEMQMTLIGFVRNGSFNIYTGAQRIEQYGR